LLKDEAIAVGDWVLVHVGFALSTIDEREAYLTLDQIKRLGQVWEDELEAFQASAIVDPPPRVDQPEDRGQRS